MRREFQETGQEQLFSRSLIEQTQAALDRGEQALILLNRRGYSFAVICRACGEKLECQNCAIALTHHKPPADDGRDRARRPAAGVPLLRIQAHRAGALPEVRQRASLLSRRGIAAGRRTARPEIFPGARIGRMDRDTVRGRHDLERLLARLHSGEINLLVGTQMIAKGHDIHGVTLVGVVGCDHALSMPDFRAAERVFQLMTQVSGRAGRGDLPGRVVVQTYYPDHYAILAASTHDYASFVERELKYRRWMHYPPFGVLANVLVQSEKLEEAAAWSAELGKWFQKTAPGRRPRARALHRADRAHQGNLSLSPDSESRLAQGAECGTARHAGACRSRRCPAPESHCGCGCAAADVRKVAELLQSAEPAFSGICEACFASGHDFSHAAFERAKTVGLSP